MSANIGVSAISNVGDIVVEEMLSQRGRLLLVVDNYKFSEFRALSTGQTKWKCIRRDCRSYLKVTVTDHGRKISEITTHNHSPEDPSRLQRQLLNGQVKKQAEVDVSENPSKIIYRCLESGYEELSAHDLKCLKKSLYYRRKKTLLVPKRIKKPIDFPSRHTVQIIRQALDGTEAAAADLRSSLRQWYSPLSFTGTTSMTPAQSNFSRKESTLAFIEAYRSLPVLWDPDNRHYSNRVLKAVAYDSLIEKLKLHEPDATRESCVKKINNLRSTFRKELRKVNDSKGYTPSLWYFNELLFLVDQETTLEPLIKEEPNEQYTEQVCKQEDEDSAEQEFQSSLGVVKSVNGPTNQNPQLPKIFVAKNSSAAKDVTRRTKRPLVYEAEETWRTAKRSLVDKSRTPKSSDPDECEMIGRHVTLQLRQLSLSDMVQANVEIQQVLMRYRLNSIFQDCDSQSSSTEVLGTVAAVYPSSPSEHSQHESSDLVDE